MAQHGGRRDPGTRQAPSGPGAFSRRTDGQKIRPPDLDDPEIQSGDVAMLTEAQRAVPVPTAASPGGGGGGGAVPVTPPPLSELRGETGLAPFVTQMPTTLPDEPIMAGSDIGAGPGSEVLMNPPTVEDDFEALLEYFARNYQDLDATEALNEMRGGVAGQPPVGPSVPELLASPAPFEEPTEDISEGLDVSAEFTDMDFDEDLGPAEVPEDQAISDAPVDEGGEAPVEGAAPAPAPEPVEE